MAEQREVYVALTGEATDVWRPVAVEPISSGLFRLIGSIPDGETWQFQPGEVVRCERRTFADGVTVDVAVGKVSS